MKILLTTVGTSGDVAPFVPLAKGLMERGHHVTVCTLPYYRSLFEAVGATFVASGLGWTKADFQAIFDRLLSAKNGWEVASLMINAYQKNGELHYPDVLKAAAGADFAVCLAYDFYGQQAVIRAGLAWASVVFTSITLSSKDYPPFQIKNPTPFKNRFLWWILDQFKKPFERKIAKDLKKKSKIKRKIALNGTKSPYLNLFAGSPILHQIGTDWGENFAITGVWLQKSDDFTPSARLSEFLKKEVDVFFSFGSMNDTNTEDLFLLFKKVIENTKVRAIIQMAGVADKFDNLPDNIFFLSEFVPYSFLFERCKIVVHHGGAGTAAAVCLSGALSVVVPHIVDQYFTGIRLHNLGVALPHIARKRLTADNLAAQIRHLLTDEAMKENAQKLAEQMRLEGGVASAVDSIERFVEERLKK